MPAIASIEPGYYRIPLPVVLSDSMHGEMTVFELNTVRVRDAEGAEGVGYTFTCGRNGVAIDALLRHDFPSLVHGEDAEVRVRRCGDQAWLTVKRGEGLVRIEVEVVISGAAFEELWAATAGAQLAKHRQEFLVDGREASLDTYTGALEGLQVVEVEFPDESTARAFTAPTWFGTEVTGRRDYTNSALARARRCPEAQ